jgi:asparagine synthase (glutamine-hydrolysing)
MCGIAGSVGFGAAAARHSVERQLRTLDHRGPDSWGIHEGRGGAIGQTRLAIIDLVTGDPPITNEDGTIGTVLNGEIYNFQLLRADLRRAGHRLQTEGDTEVIAHLAEDLEPVALADRLHGMFAFAVWDDRRERLVLGRDRLGKKPLYYWTDGTRLVFGSEIKAVLADGQVPRELDDSAVAAYLTFGYVPTPRTFYRGIRSLPPGHVLTVERGKDPRVEQYWQPQVPAPGGPSVLDLSADDAAREVRSRLTAAVERRLIADVPLGAFLSGGIDSSTVVGIMAELSPKPVLTFTIGFDDTEGFDERPFARLIAERFATEHVEFVVAPDAVDLVERLVWHHDQPFGDSSAIPTFLLSELTRRHVTVALCGDGGDELFAGYERFTAALLLERYGGLLGLGRRPLGAVLSAVPGDRLRGRAASFRRFLDRSQLGLPDAFLAWVSFLGPEWRESLLGRSENWGTEDYRQIWRRSEGSDLLDRLLDLTLRTYLLDDLLPKVDRMAMAHALEVRSPFLDHELVEFALRLPRSARVRGLSRKRALKAAAADLLPREIQTRRKRGFGVPLDRWFRSDLRSYVEGTLGAPDARVRAHLAPEALDRMLGEHQRGVANHGHALWTLLTLELFLRREGW